MLLLALLLALRAAAALAASNDSCVVCSTWVGPNYVIPNMPGGVAVRDGVIYIGDQTMSVIVKVTPPSDKAEPFVGTPGVRGWSDGVGSNAKFGSPSPMVFTTNGTLIMIDWWFNGLFFITPDGSSKLVAGQIRANSSWLNSAFCRVRAP